MKNRIKFKLFISAWSIAAVIVCAGMVLPPPATALELYRKNDWEVNLDSTLSWGLQWRVEKRDPGIIGIANGGDANSVNYDDGNLNYSRGLVSNALKLTTELDARTNRYGLFVRGTGLYDYRIMHGDTCRTELSKEAEDAIGKSVDLLDAYVWVAPDVGAIPIQFRLGDQVVSWGESTFIMGGINTINPVDVSKLRVPGAEIKEALVPEGMAWASAGLTENLTLEGLYLYDWSKTIPDEPGTYFSAADFIGDNIGTSKLMLGSGLVPDQGDLPMAQTFLAAPRDPDKKPGDQGQYGMAVRWVVPRLNDTEFGFYYLNYHARLPVLSVRTGTAQGRADAIAATIATGSATAGLNAYMKTGAYYTEYAEDLKLMGTSFSTELFGLGWQGEISYRPDAPIQIDDAELLLHILGPLNPALGSLSQLGPSTGLNQQVQGYIERDIVQAQTTLSKFLNPGFLGYDSGIILGEIAWQHVRNMPDKNTLRMEGPATYTPGSAAAAAALGVSPTPADAFADQDSFGYRLMCRVTYNNAIGPVNISPRIAWRHDISGNSVFGGAFVEGRKAVTLGTAFNYLEWSADLSYTNFFGNEERDLRTDRDFVAFTVKYSF